MSGRKTSEKYQKFRFELVIEEGQYLALCLICKKTLKNTTEQRLKTHRAKCAMVNSKDAVTKSTEPPISDQAESPGPSSQTSQNASPATVACDISSQAASSSSSTVQALKRKGESLQGGPRRKDQKMDNFVDSISKNEIGKITMSIARFVFQANLPLSVVEHPAFVEMWRNARPSYAKHIPTRKMISTTLLDQVYEENIESSSNACGSESVLLIDSWKNSSNMKVLAFLLQTTEDKAVFLDAYNVSTDSETGDFLMRKVQLAKKTALEKYKCTIYCVVSDNASNMVRMGKDVAHDMLHFTCNAHSANLLGKDLMETNKTLAENVMKILKEFKNSGLEAKVVEKGGQRIKLICGTRWCSYRDSYKCLIDNLQYMKTICAEEKQMRQDVVTLLYNSDFIQEVNKYIRIFDPVCETINLCQKSDFSLAEAADLWLGLKTKFPPEYEKIWKPLLKKRKAKVLNAQMLTAHFLHPWLKKEALNSEQMKIVDSYLVKTLVKTSDGLQSLVDYKEKRGLFGTLFENEVGNPSGALLFWKTSKTQHPTLAKLAIRLLKIPASTGQIERAFSQWGIVHSQRRNRLNFERSKKLLHIYYAAKLDQMLIRSPNQEISEIQSEDTDELDCESNLDLFEDL
ncbi:uncharacterized protein LOC132264954 [Phlebotomus argentipes]|uniref:uncharacterized protein LOC132264954 n=1 Tax=Phlebotomus argentipes TaxID=94469 RepID=UPI0028930D7B|nr:uncharacterized protein LOC132264954 [Phlebotomus argentipes]